MRLRFGIKIHSTNVIFLQLLSIEKHHSPRWSNGTRPSFFLFEVYRVLPSFFSASLLPCDEGTALKVLLGFTGFYWVLLSFTGF